MKSYFTTCITKEMQIKTIRHHLLLLSHSAVSDTFVTPWAVACQASLSMGFSRQNTGVACHVLIQGSSQPRNWTHVSCLGRQILYCWPNGKAQDTTTYLLKWLKSGTLIMANTSEDVQQQEFSFMAGGNGKWYGYFRRQFGHFLAKHTEHMIQQSCLLVFS